MTTEIQLIKKEPIPTIEVRTEAAAWKIPMVSGKSFKRVIEHLQSLGEEAAGAPYIRYLSLDWSTAGSGGKLATFIKLFTYKWKMCIGFPVKGVLTGSGTVTAGTIPGGSYIRTMHHGPYQKVGDTYNKMLAFAKEKGLKVRNESLEFYLNDPRTTKQQDLETEVLIPVEE